MTSSKLPVPAGLAPARWPAHLPRPEGAGAPPREPRPPVGPRAPERETPATAVGEDVALQRMPWKGVQWTLVFVGLLGYVFAITTYRFPIGDISMGLALFGLLMQKDRFRVPNVLIGLGVFLLWCVIGYTVTRDPVLVWGRLQTVGKLWLIGLVAANALRSRAQIRFFLTFWLACFAFWPIRGALFNYYIYHETVYGRAAWNYIFANPNDLAEYCILQLGLALALFSMERRGPVKLGATLGLAVVPLVIMLTKSRGAFLGFAAFVLFVIAGHRKRAQALVSTVILAALVIAIAPKGVLDRVQGMENVQSTDDLSEADAEGSAVQRFEIWKVARLIISDYPVTGVGLGAYPMMHARYARRSQFNPTAQGRRDTHSTYLNVTAETGFIGAFIYFFSYISTLLKINGVRRRAKKTMPHTSQALFVLICGVVGFFAAAVFGSVAHVSFLLLIVIIAWSLSDVAERELNASDVERRRLAQQRPSHLTAHAVGV